MKKHIPLIVLFGYWTFMIGLIVARVGTPVACTNDLINWGNVFTFAVLFGFPGIVGYVAGKEDGD
jgi:hypothetical protein